MSQVRFLWIMGVGLVLASAAISLSKDALTRPGRLVAREQMLTWTGPNATNQPFAKLNFDLENPGGRTVRVLSVVTGCGCMKADVSPKTFPPGGRGVVEVTARYFPTGESFVPIELETDSRVTPRVQLQVHLIGGRKPPYLMKANCDLFYMGDFDRSETRELTSYSVLGVKEIDRSPEFKNLPTYLRIEQTGVRETPYTMPNTLLKIHTYRVQFKSEPPPGLNKGEIVIVDPWTRSEVSRITSLTDFNPPARVSPPLLVLNADRPSERAKRFLVVGSKPLKSLHVEFEPRDQSDLIVTPMKLTGDDFRAEFEVRLRSAEIEVASKSPRIVLSWQPDHRVVVPVVVKGGSTR